RLEMLEQLLVALVLVELGPARPAIRVAAIHRAVGACLLGGIGLLDELFFLFGERVLGHRLVVAAEQDVGAATGHVGRDRDRALAAGLRDDRRLALVLLGVEDVERQALL